jgi:hypothetical protein
MRTTPVQAPPARWSDALRAELRIQAHAPMPLWVILLLAGAVFFGMTYSELHYGTVESGWILSLFIIGAIGAMEFPSRREARLALPVSRPAHALARGVARALQIFALIALMLPAPMLLAWLAAGAPAGEAAVLLESLVRLVVAATVAFLLVYAVMLHTDALLWLTVPFFGFVLAMALAESGPLAPVGDAMVAAYASLGVVLLGRDFGAAPFHGAWAANATVWLAAGAAAVLLSASLLRER